MNALNEKKIDWSKPVQTKDGDPVTIFRTDLPIKQCVVGVITGHSYACTWDIEGSYWHDKHSCGSDLENVPLPPVKRKLWLNIYERNGDVDNICVHTTKKSAEHSGCSNQTARIEIEIEYTPGQGV